MTRRDFRGDPGGRKASLLKKGLRHRSHRVAGEPGSSSAGQSGRATLRSRARFTQAAGFWQAAGWGSTAKPRAITA